MFVFDVRVISNEKCEDGVSANKHSYIAIHCVGAIWKQTEIDQVKQLLATSDIDNTFVKTQFNLDDHYAIPVAHMFKAVDVFQRAKVTVKSHLPYQLWRPMRDEPEPIPYTAIEEKIGSELWAKLRGFQKTAVQFAVSRRIAYIADEMGCGKTLESLASLLYFKDRWPVLVLCPGMLKHTWKTEIHKWLGVEEEKIQILKNSTDIGRLDRHVAKKGAYQFLLVSYDLVHRPKANEYLSNQDFDAVVMDECHYIKSRDSKRSNAALRLTKNCSVKFLLSGTPFNYPDEMFQQIKAINPTIFPKFFDYRTGDQTNKDDVYFARRYCNPEQTCFRNQVQWQFHGYERPVELNAILNTFMIRRRKHEVLSQLPSKTRTCITLPSLKPKEKRELVKLMQEERSGTVTFKGQEMKRNDQRRYMQSFRKTCAYKRPNVMEFIKKHVIEDLLTNDSDLCGLIFAHHQEMHTQIKELFDDYNAKAKARGAETFEYFAIDGKTTRSTRNQYQDEFRDTSKYRVGILSITACATGLTLTRASFVIKTEIMFGGDLHFQAEDRTHRIGQKKNVTVFYLIQPGGTDDANWGLIRKKERESSRMLDGVSNEVWGRRINPEEHKAKGHSLLFVPRGKPPKKKEWTKKEKKRKRSLIHLYETDMD